MTVPEMLAEATRRLERSGVASPGVDAELLLAHVLGVTRPVLRLQPEPSDSVSAEFERLLVRRCGRVPVQHLTGTAPFRHLEVEVGPGVFVPRPETESLVQWALQVLAESGDGEPVVVDLCTGSGAIAAAIADEAPHARVHAVELDERAYAYALRNLEALNVDLRHGDVADCLHDLDGHVDLVLANPPYIPLAAYDGVEPEVRDHDPSLALWSGEDGLDMVRVVERVAHRLLTPSGHVGCEHADRQGSSAVAVFSDPDRWLHVRDLTDLAGRPRFVVARRSGPELP